MPEDDDSLFLYLVDYEEDAERKRAEYLFNNWDDGTIERPSGLARIAEGIDSDELYEQLVTKVPAEQVRAYRLDSAESDVDPETVTVEERINASVDAVEAFLEYILSKKKAVLQSASRNEYEAYTKKGRAEVSYDLTDDGGEIVVRVQVAGYPPAPSFLAESFEAELAEYATSQAPD
jgi:hypothetical protein